MTDTLSKLLPCPFCGGNIWIGKVQKPNGQSGWVTSGYRAWCSECKTSMAEKTTKAECIAAWNTRAANSGVVVTDDWLRDTAMNVMLADEVEEAVRILSAALTAEPQAVEPVAWEIYSPGCGSIDSATRLTRFKSTMEQWAKEGAEITPLYAQPHPAAVPDGWVMVPKEPTEAMIKEGENAYWAKRQDTMSPTPTEHPDDGGGCIGYSYRAMLAAAPSPLSNEVGK